ncbi:MAG: SCO family protein [Phenylobacterium sp.]
MANPRGAAAVVVIAVLAGLVLVAGVHPWRRGETPQTQLPPASRALVGGPFSLVDPAGRPVTDRDFRGRFMLIYFGYTTCPGHCPTMLAMTAAALETLGPQARQVQPIFITVDPEHDTPEVMGRYTSRFSQRILGLTGSLAQIASVEKAYGVQTRFRRTGAEGEGYAIDHPSVLYLVGPDGRFIAELPTDGGADDLAARIRPRL